MAEHDVVVVGAGLSGLACARELTAHGLRPVVLESADRPGGRVATEQVDGFLVDRGFQVLNPAYPHLRQLGVLDELQLRAFPRAVRVRHDGGLTELADPTRNPLALAGDLRSGLVGVRDLAAARVALQLPAQDRPRGEAFDRAGFTGPLRQHVVDPFLAGVVCERDGSTSARFTAWLSSMFLLGTPGLPTGGMRRLPEVLARGLDVRFSHHVTALDGEAGTVQTEQGGFSGRAVVLAAGPMPSAELTGTERPQTHPTTTLWFATDQAPSDTAAIHVDGDGHGPVVTTSVVSHAAPEYAPDGQHLVAALTLANGDLPEEQVREHLARIYGVDTSAWRTVAVHQVPHTLPAVPPGAFNGPRVAVRGTTVTCGDQFGNASIDGALSSGQEAARTVLGLLGR